MNRICFALVAAAACGGKPTPVANTTREAGSRPAHYAALFQPGASWTYSVSSSAGGKQETHMATCKVTAVRDIQGGQAADSGCEPHLMSVDGTWVADPRGPWRRHAAHATSA